MYTYDDRIKYSEVSSDLKLTYFALVNYMQNCSCFHSDDIGFGISYLTPKNLGWFVTSYEIHINKMPEYSQKVRVATYPYQFRGMMARRMYTISSLDGELLAYADSQWILMNLESGRPERVTAEMLEAYSDGVPNPELKFEGDKLRATDTGTIVGEFEVTDRYIDTNGHMNNSFYIDATKTFLPTEDFSSIKINYKKEALLNDKLEVHLVELEIGYQVILMKNDEIYTILEYK